MKVLSTLLLFCCSIAALFAQSHSRSALQLLSSGGGATTLRLNLNGFDPIPVATPQGQANVIAIQHGTPLLRKGAPDVPKFVTALLIPNTGNMAVEILSGDFDDYPGVQVAPSKGNLKRTVNPGDVPYEYGAEYQRDQFFPGALAEQQTPFILRSVRGQAVWIYPVQYNPVQKVLRVYRSITLRVYPAGGRGENELTHHPAIPNSSGFGQLYQRLFVNANSSLADRGGSPQTPEKMLVIAKDELLGELQPLIDWKRQMGIHTTVVPVSAIGSSESSAVYNFVKDYYFQHGISYLLLVGDENGIQPEMRQDGDSYSCDNCFGYFEGNDHFPEVLVGRLHAATPEQLRIMVNRNLEYEMNPKGDSTQNWFATGMASGSNQGAGIGDDGQADWEQCNEWKIAHLANGFKRYWEFYDGDHNSDSPTPGDASADQNGDPTNVPLINLMNGNGVSLYNYTGHGWEQGLESGNFSTDAVAQLRNTHRYPMLIAVACCAGNFTNGECLGETWQRAGNLATGEPWGGIAGFFSSDYQSWSPPMEGQDGMNQYLIDADSGKLRPRMSAMLAYGNARMIAAYGANGESMADFWNPFVEPSTVPRTRLPIALTATHAASVPFETTQITVNCPVEDALVSLYWQNQTWAVGYVKDGKAVIDIDPLNNVGEMKVTVTQFNYLPYQGAITVEPATKPFVISQRFDLDDSAGNNNHKADFGETVQLNVLCSNIGLGTAGAVSATLSSADPLVHIVNGQATLGNLNSQDSTLASFVFQVEPVIKNGHIAVFQLDITYSDSIHYSTPIAVTLNAPAFKVVSWSIVDSAGGNGNGRLESGETAVLRIINQNVGGSDSPVAVGTISSGSPFVAVSAADTLGQLAASAGEKAAVFYLTVLPASPVSISVALQYHLGAGDYTTDEVIEPLIVNPIVETFETNGFGQFGWTQAGNKPWTTTSVGAYAGQYCARSGIITHNQKSVMKLPLLISDKGYISFARRVSSEADYDFLFFYIDDQIVGAWSGNVPWGEVSFPVEAGQHTFMWSYEKDDIVSSGSDRAWVDNVILPPHQIVVSASAPERPVLDAQLVPNPTAGPVTLLLDLPEEQTLNIQLLDQLGRLVQTLQAPLRTPAGRQILHFDLSAQLPGMYLVQIRGEKGAKTLRIVR